MFVLPPYLDRDHDTRLREHLSRAADADTATFALIWGESCTGKTRAAFEAVRAYLPDWQLLFPKNIEMLQAVLDAGTLAPRTVLWLSETENYVSGDGGEQAAAALHGRLDEPGAVVVIGTMWPEYYRQLTSRPDPGQATPDEHFNARSLIARAWSSTSHPRSPPTLCEISASPATLR